MVFIVAVALVLAIVLFAAGYLLGMRTSRVAFTAIVLNVVPVVFIFLLLFAARTQAEKIGPVVVQVAAFVGPLIWVWPFGGFAAAVAQKERQGKIAAGIVGVAVLLTSVLLGKALGKVGAILNAAREIGLTNQTRYEPEKNKDCPENLKSLYLAFQLYAQDWDALPPAANWLDNEDLTSKVRQNEWLHCPEVSNRHDDKWGYAYNEAVAVRPLNHQELKQQPSAATTPLLYDSSILAKNAHDRAASLPKPGRHSGRNNILYLDGHVEAVAPK